MLDVKILLERDGFCKLDDASLVALAHLGSVFNAKKGTRISAQSMVEDSIYLYEGEVELQNVNGARLKVDVSSERAKVPLFRFNADGLHVECLTNASFLKFPRHMIRKLSVHDTEMADDGFNVEEHDDVHSLENNRNLIDEIRQQFNSKEVTLPALPAISSFVEASFTEPDMNFDRLTGIIQTAPTICARIISVANSEMFGLPTKIDSIAQAINRIGVESVHAIVKSVSHRNVFEPKSDLIKAALIKYYEHSARLGVICYVLTQHRPEMDSDHAFLVGILHEIGTVAILVVADKYPELVPDAETLEKTVADLKQEVSIMLLKQWQFPDEYANVSRDAQNWQRDIETADYCDIVQVALKHLHLVGGDTIEGPALNTLPSFHRLGLDKLDPAENIKMLNELGHRVKEMIKTICR